MAANEYTAKFSIDISDLKKGMQQANQMMKVANSEFKAATGGMDSWGKSADGLSAKLKQLNTVHDAQNAKLEILQAEYDRVTEAEGKNSKGAQDLYIKMNNLKGEIGKTESQISKYSAALSDLQKEQSQSADSAEEVVSASEKLKRTISDQESELSSLKSEYSSVVLEQGEASSEAKKLASSISKLSSDLATNKADLNAAESAADEFDKTLDDLGDSAEEASDGFTVLKGAMANLVASGIKSLASGLVNGMKSLAGLSQETQEYREDLGKLETAFESAGISTQLATKTYKDFYSVLGEEDRSVEAVNHLAKFVETEKDMATWTDIAAGVWGTFGDSLPIEGLTEAANETAKVGEVTGPLADALNWAGVSESEFNASLEKCNSEQERAQLITSTLNGLYSKAAKNYKENNASIIESRKATSDYNDTMAELGEKVEPVTTGIRKGLNRVLQEALKLADGVDFSKVASSIESGFSYFIDEVLPKIKEGITWIIENKDTLISAVTSIGAAIATAFMINKIVAFVGIIQKVITAVKGAGAVIAGLKGVLALLGGPVTIVIGVIFALVGAFVYLWNTSEGFRDFWIGLWEKIKSAAAVALEWFKGLPEWFSQIWETAKTGVSNFVESVANWFSQLPGRISTFISQVWNDIKKWASNMWAKAKELGKNFLDAIVGFFKQLPGKIHSFVTSALNKVITWASNMASKAKETGSKFISNIVSFFTKLPGKIWEFLSSAITKAGEFVTKMGSKAKEAGTKFLNNVIDNVKDLPSKLWSKLSSAITKAGEFVTKMGSKAKEAASEFVSKITSGLAGLPGDMWDIGSNIVQSIWNGISSGWEWLKSKVSGLASSLFETAKNVLGIHSPSRVFRDGVGKQIAAGIGVGVDKYGKIARNSVKTLAGTLLPEAENLQEGLNAKFSRMRYRITGVPGDVPMGGNTYQTFNQYNNSPKALSRLDIYRQTKNQLAFAKGV